MYLLVGRKYLNQFKETKYENSNWIGLTYDRFNFFYDHFKSLVTDGKITLE